MRSKPSFTSQPVSFPPSQRAQCSRMPSWPMKAMDTGDTTAFDMKALRGRDARWRLRVGDYRVVYTIEDGRLVVWVLTVGNRREICRQVP
ncbi:type II toxin-antitoxin system RelE family toxin [Streptomyces cellulosae]